MIDICDRTSCTGCMACVNVCAKKAIEMIADEQGFLRPAINQGLCVDCGLCSKLCPVNTSTTKHQPIQVFSGWSRNEKIRMTSSSGGAFSEIALPILRRGGVVFGCMLDDNLQAVHGYVETEEDLAKLRGSKYFQSRINASYKDTKRFLQEGREVLFSGTPCQIAGLKNYLGKDYEKLITVDLVCHGVPSPKVFEDWKCWFKKKYDLKYIKTINFRGKKSSWIFYRMTVAGHSVKKQAFLYEGGYYEDEWIRGFLRDYFLRPSCYQCKYTDIKRVSDFTIADWWGYKPQRGESNDYEKKGVSLILCNTKKGGNYFSEHCHHNMTLRERTVEEALKTNPSLRHPFGEPSLRKQFWDDYTKMSFQEIADKYFYVETLTLPQYISYRMPNGIIKRFLLWFSYKLKGLFKRLHLKEIKIKANRL